MATRAFLERSPWGNSVENKVFCNRPLGRIHLSAKLDAYCRLWEYIFGYKQSSKDIGQYRGAHRSLYGKFKKRPWGGKNLLRVKRSFYVLKYFLYEGCTLPYLYYITLDHLGNLFLATSGVKKAEKKFPFFLDVVFFDFSGFQMSCLR